MRIKWRDYPVEDYLTKPLVDLRLDGPVGVEGVVTDSLLTIILPLFAALIISMVIIPDRKSVV